MNLLIFRKENELFHSHSLLHFTNRHAPLLALHSLSMPFLLSAKRDSSVKLSTTLKSHSGDTCVWRAGGVELGGGRQRDRILIINEPITTILITYHVSRI